ncbi:hypothetical protein P7K49_000059 [Saguinus oedipus]|uniref:Uncharacterized protein n=1 Tax=Saguinus oedipus TaxID=9490 RepID=A0ABQ9WD13_SAGOE|nr:hypothetical protein P7K49_000059 [Saguinus oedipus]
MIKSSDDSFFSCSPKRSKTCSDVMSVDAQALKKKMGKMACDPAARAILGSLLLYVAGRADRPPGTEAGGSRAGRQPQPQPQPQPQEAAQRPTRFQLLQAKFLGPGRERCLKRTREVGRLISRDKQGPGRGLVSATINKLLEKTREPAPKPCPSEKPRWGHPAGKSPVKNILKKFLAAEEKEAKEKEAREKPPAERPRARGLLPKIVGKSSVLAKLREKFEQSSCLCSEAGALRLRTEERKRRNLQRKRMHRPEVRVLHTAAMASTCVRTPPARFLACTADPLPALSVATVVCGPRSWLSHCTKISHSEARRQPRAETSMPPSAGETGLSGNKAAGKGPLEEEPQRGPSPLKPGMPQVTARRDGHAGPSLAPSWAPYTDEAHPGLVPASSPLGPTTAKSTADDVQEVRGATIMWCPGPTGEGVEGGPEITMTVCSSEDETEGTGFPDPGRNPHFATQKYFPEQKVPEHIPPLNTPSVQAAGTIQPSTEPPRITVQIPVIHEMPASPTMLQNASSGETQRSRIFGGENVAEKAQTEFSTVTENRWDNRTPVEPSKPSGTQVRLGTSSPQGSRAVLHPAAARGASGANHLVPETAPTQRTGMDPAGGKGIPKGSFESSHSPRSPEDISGERTSELRDEMHLLQESNEISMQNKGSAANSPAAAKNPLRGNTGHASRGQQVPSPTGRYPTGAPMLLATPSKEHIGPGGVTSTGTNMPSAKEEHRRLRLTESAQTLKAAEEITSHDFGENPLSSLNEPPKPGMEACGEVAATGSAVSLATPTPTPGGTQSLGEPETLGQEKYRALSESHSRGEALPPDPHSRGFLAPWGSSEPKSRAAGRSLLRGTALTRCPEDAAALARHPEDAAALARHPEDAAALARHPEDAAALARHPEAPRLHISNASAAMGDIKDVPVEENLLGKGTKSGTPASDHPRTQARSVAGSPSHGPGGPPLPSENPQGKGREGIDSPRWAEPEHLLPVVPPAEADTGWVGGTHQRDPPHVQAQLPLTAGDTQAKLWASVSEPRTQAGEAQKHPPTQAGETRKCPLTQRGESQKHPPTQADLGRQQSHQAQEEAPEPSDAGKRVAPLGLKVVRTAAKEPQTQWAQDLGGDKGTAIGVGGACQHSDQGQQRPQGPWEEQGRRAVQGEGTRAAKNPAATPGDPKGLGSLVAQGQAQKQAQEKAQGQPQRQIQTEAQGQPQWQIQREAQRQIQTEAQGQAQRQIQTEAQGQAQRQIQTEAQGQAQRQIQREAQGQAQRQIQTEAQGQAQRQIQTEAQGQAQRQIQTEAQGQAQRQIQTEAQGQPQWQIQREAQRQIQREAQGQALACGTVSRAWEQPISGTAELVATAGRSGGSGSPVPGDNGQWMGSGLGEPSAQHPSSGSHPLGGKSIATSPLGLRKSPAEPTPEAGSWGTPQAPTQEGPLDHPRAKRDLQDTMEASEPERLKRSTRLAKYKAQSFSDQRAFDLSFRPMSLRASDTFELPK